MNRTYIGQVTKSHENLVKDNKFRIRQRLAFITSLPAYSGEDLGEGNMKKLDQKLDDHG